MSSVTTDEERYTEAGFGWFSALAEPLSLAAKAGERVEALDADLLEIEVFCDRPPSMEEVQTQTMLLGLLETEIEADTATDGRPRYCKLLGSTLSEASRSSVAESGACGLTGFSRTSEAWYRLVATEAEMPIGFCTFSLLFEGSSNGPIPETPACVEIAEVWLSPEYRGSFSQIQRPHEGVSG